MHSPQIAAAFLLLAQGVQASEAERRDKFNAEWALCHERSQLLSSENGCLQLTATVALSVTVILAVFVWKVPQMIKIWRAKSVKGISRIGAYLDLWLFFVGALYVRHRGFEQMSNEAFWMTLQSSVIVALIFHFDKKITQTEMLLVVGAFTLSAFALV